MKNILEVIKSSDYQSKLESCFGNFGYELIENEKEQKVFKELFKDGLNDNIEKTFLKVIGDIHWFFKSSDGERFGVFYDNEKEQYSCIVLYNPDMELYVIGYNLIDWVEETFESIHLEKSPSDISQNLSIFKEYYQDYNLHYLNLYPKISMINIFDHISKEIN